jgi:hypothetical protein
MNMALDFNHGKKLCFMIKLVTIDDLKPGDILSGPVMNNFGQIMIPAGAVLKENHIRLLKSWETNLNNRDKDWDWRL